MNKRLSIAAMMLMPLFFALPENLQAQQLPKHKIVMQLSSADTMTWKGLMNNLRNLKEGWGDSLAIEVVAHGPGIELLMQQKTTQLENIRKMIQKGIVFYACENTMKEKKILPESIIPEATFVKMGIGHIVLRQEAGWTYIKAGF
jgi:intracellular sulfur oxidation DsrE/DsrF family protein